jgi:hypothetical protein
MPFAAACRFAGPADIQSRVVNPQSSDFDRVCSVPVLLQPSPDPPASSSPASLSKANSLSRRPSPASNSDSAPPAALTRCGIFFLFAVSRASAFFASHGLFPDFFDTCPVVGRSVGTAALVSVAGKLQSLRSFRHKVREFRHVARKAIFKDKTQKQSRANAGSSRAIAVACGRGIGSDRSARNAHAKPEHANGWRNHAR